MTVKNTARWYNAFFGCQHIQSHQTLKEKYEYSIFMSFFMKMQSMSTPNYVVVNVYE